MANGQQKAQQNAASFQAWAATQSEDDFRQIIFQGQLNRGEIAKAICCGRSALNQNPELRKQLQQLEDGLRARGVLPPLTAQAKASADMPKEYDPSAHRRQLDAKRLSALEQENIELKAKVIELQRALERYGELSETLSEMGFMPR